MKTPSQRFRVFALFSVFGLSTLAVVAGCSDSSAVPARTVAKGNPTPTPKAASAAAASAPASRPSGAASQPSRAKPQTQAERFAAAQQRISDANKRLNRSPAGKLILKAIESHGGLKAWFSQDAIRFTYDYVPVNDASKRKKSDQTIDVLRSRAYHTLEYPTTGTFAFDGKQAWSKLDGDVKFPARFWALTPFYFAGMPYVLSDPGVKLEIVDHSAAAAGFEAADVVAVTFEAGVGDAPDDTYFIYLDPKSSRVLGVRYTVTYAPFFDGKAKKRSADKLIHYGDVRPVGPLHFPHSHQTFMFDPAQAKATKKRAALSKKVTQANLSDVVYAAPFDESRLEMPAGATIDGALKTKAPR